ncbi:MAG TPA: 50S ribosomal protein L11 methyltransferase [Anaerolineae bacterium]|nr:50S ribosomal protein L11 methyltransferase [Anaerolineae bacterium]
MPDGAKVRWLEISVTTDGEAAEAVVELFNRYGHGQAVIETPLDCFEHELEEATRASSVIVKTYLPLNVSGGDVRQRLEEGLWHLAQLYPIPEPVIRELDEESWAEAWKQQYHRLRIGRRTVIVPAWETYDSGDGEVVIRLEPGMAFGTGLHPTTRLCLEAMETAVRPGSRVLDVGTGSGVLAIAAALLEAGTVLALDADPVAVRVAEENVAANGVAGRVEVRHGSLPGGESVPLSFALEGSLPLLEAGQFDLVVVNILAPVIAGMAPALAARTRPGGSLIAAGLILDQEPNVMDALQSQGLQIAGRSQEEDWVCLLARRP